MEDVLNGEQGCACIFGGQVKFRWSTVFRDPSPTVNRLWEAFSLLLFALGSLSLVAIDIVGQIIFCRMFMSIPGPFLLNASSIPICDNQDWL